VAASSMNPGSGRPGGIIEGINMTPLVDIMLVLLVIFMVTAKILATPALPLDLPSATKVEEIQTVFAVTVAKTGALFVNGEAVPDVEALRTRAAEAVGRDPELRAVIDADREVPHGKVIELLDALRRGGLAKVAFGTRPEEPAAP
jgi:biopolymer transport protein TolR